MSGLQNRPVDPHPSPHCRGLCSLTGTDDHRQFITTMNPPFNKSWPNSLSLVRVTGDPCPGVSFFGAPETPAPIANRGTVVLPGGGRPFPLRFLPAPRSFSGAGETHGHSI